MRETHSITMSNTSASKATGSANGMLFDTDTIGANVSKCWFGYLYAQHTDGYGIRIGNVRQLRFRLVTTVRASGSGDGIQLGAGDGVNNYNARGNLFFNVATTGGGGLIS